MAAGSLAPNSANEIKQAKLALVGLAGQNWPISNTPLESSTRSGPLFFDDENKKWSSMTGKMKSGGNGLKMDSIPHNQHTKLSSLAPAVLIAGRCGRPKWKTSIASSYGYKCSANS
jgi:hypothetical protein